MKIAVSAAGRSLDSRMDPRFGRCQYLLVVDSESMSFEAVQNPGVTAPGGAGIQAAELVGKMGAKAVITGDCGPNAHEVLSAASIDVFLGASGTAREAIERHRRGELRAASGPSAGLHAGVRPGVSRGMGRGRGGGGGRGGGMGGRRGGGGQR